MAQGERVVIHRANTRRRRTEEYAVEIELGANGQSRTASGRQAGGNGRGETRREGSEFVERIVIEPVREKPPVPPKKAHLIKNPVVLKHGTDAEIKPLTVSGLWGSGRGLTVGRNSSGQLYLVRKKTRHGKPPPVVLPPESDTSSESI